MARIARELDQLRRALDESAIVALTDDEGVILHVNDRFCAISGFSREELIGKTHRVVNSGYHDEAFFRDLWMRIAAGHVWRGRIQNRRKNGSTYWVDTTITPLFGNSGPPERYLAVRYDVTELVRTAEALFESERRLRGILDNAAVGVAVVGLDDRFVEASAALRRMLRCDEKTIENHPFTDFSQPSEEGLDRQLFHELVEGRRDHYQIDRRYVRCDGTTFLGHTTVSLVRDEEGRPDHVIGVIEDVTEIRANEQRLRERGALARLGEMSAIIAHEVRNPLAGIRGAVEIIGRSLPGNGPQHQAIESIVDRIKDLDELLTQVLLFARPRPPRPTRISLRSVLERVREHAGPAAVAIEGEDVELMADPSILERAFTNLAINAVQATGGSGPVRIVLVPSDDRAVVELVDAGPGIPDEHAERIFEPFFTTKSRGAGLGLAIARASVEAHGGTLELVRSTPGETCLRVVLPLAPGGR
ncbi:MAG: PAS domain S-box protein [Myxococcales bacterium]|nr:PAS domain S-box protein [Myxococcales bacterium]